MSTAVRLFVSFLFLLALTACAAVSSPLERPPIAYPEELRQRLVELALREWEAFGGGIIDQRGPQRVVLRESMSESDPRVFHLLQGYWNAVREEQEGWGWHIEEQRELYRKGASETWDVPWSAAFISYLMRSAGVDRLDFRWSAAHSFYLDHALHTHRQWGDRALYTPIDLEDHQPLPGDLLCQDRSRPAARRLQRVAQRWEEAGRFRPMHCDLVVASHPFRLSLVGGNLSNSVQLIYLPLNAQGYVPRGLGAGDKSASPFALLRLNVPYSEAIPLLSEAAR